MRYKYRDKAEATKALGAKKIPGIPKDISLLFENLYIRFYKSLEFNHSFYCSVGIPIFSDDEGYVLEIDFVEEVGSGDDGDFSEYTVQLNDCSFENISNFVSCYFEEKNEMGQRMILLYMKIKGTPFYGYAYIEKDLYNIIE